MNSRRIIVVATLAAGIPLVVGFLFGLLGGGGDTMANGGLYQLRVWSIRVLLVLVFAWLGWVQRERLLPHAAIAVGAAWVIAELLALAIHLLMTGLQERASLPPIPAWSPSLSFLLSLLVIAAIGVVTGSALRAASRRRTVTS